MKSWCEEERSESEQCRAVCIISAHYLFGSIIRMWQIAHMTSKTQIHTIIQISHYQLDKMIRIRLTFPTFLAGPSSKAHSAYWRGPDIKKLSCPSIFEDYLSSFVSTMAVDEYIFERL